MVYKSGENKSDRCCICSTVGLFFLLLFAFNTSFANTLKVGEVYSFKKIKQALAAAKPGDSILVYPGVYKEQNIIVDKKVFLIGVDYPVVDGEKKYEIFSVKADSAVISGFKVQHSGYATLDDPGGIKLYDANYVTVSNNILDDNFFGIYIQYGKHCVVKNNTVVAYGKEEQLIGNGIHCWKSDSLLIEGNNVRGHRDGIYFEFVTHSVIWRNISTHNVRYGLHFMFSNSDAYYSNYFSRNGAGVAVMFTKDVKMENNTFEENWGDAAYGLMLKEISDSYIHNNRFIGNTSGIYMEGTSRIEVEHNIFQNNGWGMTVQASCMDNNINQNNFLGNTFDISTNGSLVLNNFDGNYWDKYEGYDLNKDAIGDVPYHPLSLFAVIAERNPATMLLFRSMIISLLDKSEKMIPSLTPDNFVDNKPLMRALQL